MESDDDYESFSPSQEPSPKVQHRRLKRLKRAIRSPNISPVKSTERSPKSSEDSIPSARVEFEEAEALDAFNTLDSEHSQGLDFAKFGTLESGKSLLDSEDYDRGLSEEGGEVQKPLKSDEENYVDLLGDKHKEVKRALGFSDILDEIEGDGKERDELKEEEYEDLKVEKLEKKRSNVVNLDVGSDDDIKKKKKKKRMESNGIDDGRPKPPAVNKRKEEKERKAHLKQLHSDTQRVLRETRDAAFRPDPIVHKPISSVLEKIRQRKLEVSKRTLTLKRNVPEKTGLNEVTMDFDSVDGSDEEIEVKKSLKIVDDKRVENAMDAKNSLGASSMAESNEGAIQTRHKIVPAQTVFDEEPTPAFRAPVEDTQDLFGDSQESGSKYELSGDQPDSPLVEETFAPSLLAMKLKFDSAPPDDSSSEEEDNEKENLDPHLLRDHVDCASPNGDPMRAFIDEEAEEEQDSDNDIDLLRDHANCASPKGDPMRAFIDEEAEEEQDSDNDIDCLKEIDEDEDLDGFEEVNDIIATDFEERPIDKERRDELHQKWLEQQDAAGTDNILQRFNCNLKTRETTLVDNEHTDDLDDEENSNEAEDVVPRDSARMTSKRAKQMIAQMFQDKDDVFESDEEEETEKKQRLLVRSDAKLVSPAEDESSREVFGLIKKLNIASDNKRRPKASSLFDTMLRGSTNGSSKSSFLGRISNHHLPSSHKQGASVVRSYVFGRDDSNSRSSISIAEDFSDTNSLDNRSSRSATAKCTRSLQAKASRQSSSSAFEEESGTSLLDLLKNSSVQSSYCNQTTMIDLSGSLLNACKIPKKPVRIEGRG